MIGRGFIRALVPYDKVMYFIGGRGQQMGIGHDWMKLFEQEINRKVRARSQPGKRPARIRVVFIPVARERLVQGLWEGIGDVAAANLTITPPRARLVDFTIPFSDEVRELWVTGPASPSLAGPGQLAGREVVVRKSSSYYESLLKLNHKFQTEGRAPVRIILAPDDLEDGDLAEMVAAGIYPATVLDGYLASFWSKVFGNLVAREDILLRERARIAFAVRKECPQLKKELDALVARTPVVTTGNDPFIQKYLRDTQSLANALDDKSLSRFRRTVDFIRKYADLYRFDWLLIAAQGYQESGLDQTQRGPTGAVGVMQILPETAAKPPIGIPRIHELEPNIHAGVKYLRLLADEYFADPAITAVDRHLFAFAAYNAGPARINRLRAKAASQGLDPNKWFQNVEIVTARYVGSETTNYVGNIFKYYVAYKHFQERAQKRLPLMKPTPSPAR